MNRGEDEKTGCENIVETTRNAKLFQDFRYCGKRVFQ